MAMIKLTRTVFLLLLLVLFTVIVIVVVCFSIASFPVLAAYHVLLLLSSSQLFYLQKQHCIQHRCSTKCYIYFSLTELYAVMHVGGFCWQRLCLGGCPELSTISKPYIGLYREYAIAIQDEVGDSNGGKV